MNFRCALVKPSDIPRLPARPSGWIALLAALAVAGGASPAIAQLRAKQVEDSIYRAAEWIKKERNEDGHWERNERTEDRYWAGDSGLALLALLYAGENPRSEEMDRGLTWLAAQTLNSTYTYSVRAQVLSQVPSQKFRARLEQDVRWLVDAMAPRGWRHGGAYGYVDAKTTGEHGWYDHSNSQFGVLGVWMGCESGLRTVASSEYWLTIEDRWMHTQNIDGGWGYQRNMESTGSMTAAGLATLYIVLDQAHAMTGHRKATGLLRSIDGALEWLGREYTPDNPHGEHRWKYYYLYGVERAGRASGRKYFRGRDWFREGAADLIKTQSSAGSWGGGLHDTCFATMFLAHGRAPLLFCKLERGGDWDVYLRDVATLTRYAERALERLLNWQVVDLAAPVEELLEAPVLYISGKDKWELEDGDVFKLREYCQRGGMIFAVVAEDGEAFEESMRELAARLFPDDPLRPMASDHELFNGQVLFKLERSPMMYEVNNGARTLMLLSLDDVARAWNENRIAAKLRDFQLGTNIYLLATDKTTPVSRLETPDVPLESVDVDQTIRVARVRYTGPWNVEPYGWTRLRYYMNNEARARLLVSSGVSLASIDPKEYRIAYISGSRGFELNEAEINGLRRFLTSGGTLLADAAGGSREFTESLEKHVTAVLGARPTLVDKESFLFTGRGIAGAGSITPVEYRRSARGHPGQGTPYLKAVEVGRRMAVIYSPLDLSTGLLGTPAYGCNGYAPESCLKLMRNLLMYANLSSGEKGALAERR